MSLCFSTDTQYGEHVWHVPDPAQIFIYISQVAKMSFIFDLTAGVYFNFYNICGGVVNFNLCAITQGVNKFSCSSTCCGEAIWRAGREGGG